MTDDRREYELDYWRGPHRDDRPEKYRRLLELWESGTDFPGQQVMEIGTGPLLGVLPYIRARRRIGVDPLYDHYREEKLLADCPGIEAFASPVEAWPDIVRAFGESDVVFSSNCLDHLDIPLVGLVSVSRLLIPGGMFHFHMHLRTREQLNLNHCVYICPQELAGAIKAAGLRPIRQNTFTSDPASHAPYKTIVGTYEKIA